MYIFKKKKMYWSKKNGPKNYQIYQFFTNKFLTKPNNLGFFFSDFIVDQYKLNKIQFILE